MSIGGSRAVVVSLLLAAGNPASAENRHLEAARRAREQLEYDKVTPLLDKALSESDDPKEQAEIYELLALMHVMYSRRDAARDAFVELLRRRADYQLPASSSPKLKAAFAAAREIWTSAPPEVREGSAPAQLPVGPDLGAAALPEHSPPLETAPPLYQRWWFWGIVAACVSTAAGAGLWAAAHPSRPATDFGPLRLP